MNESIFSLEPTESLAVQAIRNKGPLSRTDLARELDYSRASLTIIVGNLLEAGILVEVGEGKSGGGRRPKLLLMRGILNGMRGWLHKPAKGRY